MKLPKVILAVLGLHVGVIGLFMFQAGCQSSKQPLKAIHPDAEIMDVSATSHQADLAAAASADTIDPEFNAGLTTEETETEVEKVEVVVTKKDRKRMPPTRPEKKVEIEADKQIEIIPVEAPVKTAVNRAYKENTVYTVQKGDSIWKISQRYGITISELLSANGLGKNAVIYPGQELTVPLNAGSIETASVSVAPKEEKKVVAGEGEYIVQGGDSLSKIARKFGTTVSALQSVNNLNGTTIYRGQKLVLPVGSGSAPAVSAPVKKQVSAPISGGSVHVVKRGDTLGKIAKKYSVSLETLMQSNGISDPRRLQIGQKLVLSGVASAAVKSAPVKTAPPPVQEVQEPVTIGVISSEAPQETVPEIQAQAQAFQNIDEIPTVEVETVSE